MVDKKNEVELAKQLSKQDTVINEILKQLKELTNGVTKYIREQEKIGLLKKAQEKIRQRGITNDPKDDMIYYAKDMDGKTKMYKTNQYKTFKNSIELYENLLKKQTIKGDN